MEQSKIAGAKNLYLIQVKSGAKLQLAKLVHALFDLSWKDSVYLVEGVPQLLMENVPPEKQDESRKIFEDAGGVVEYR